MNKVIYSLFALVILVSLVFSGYSLWSVATDVYGVPQYIAWATSLTFDGTAIVLALLLVERTVQRESTSVLSSWMYLSIVLSGVFNVSHAVHEQMSIEGTVLFASFPVLAGVLIHFILKRIFAQSLKAAKIFAPEVSRKAKKLDKDSYSRLQAAQVEREYEEAFSALGITGQVVETVQQDSTPEDTTAGQDIVEDKTEDIVLPVLEVKEEKTVHVPKDTVQVEVDSALSLPSYLDTTVNYSKTSLARTFLANGDTSNVLLSQYATLLGLDMDARSATKIMSNVKSANVKG